MHPATDLVTGDSTALPLRVRRLGLRPYLDACAIQEHQARRVAAGANDQLLLLRHPPVITLGRATTPEQLLATPRRLAAVGITVAETDRGGGATFHGPGQLVGYLVVDLRRRGLGVRTYLRAIESALVVALHDIGIEAYTRPGLTGVWTPRGKVAAIGVAVRRGITRHGFALGVRREAEGFEHIVPCGLRQPVTTLEELGGPTEERVLSAGIAPALERALGSGVTDDERRAAAEGSLAAVDLDFGSDAAASTGARR